MLTWHGLGTALLACAMRPADDPFPEGMVALKAQPAVFTVALEADFEVESPESVTLDLGAIRADLGSAKGEARSDADRAWILLGNDPEKYLVASPRRMRKVIPGALSKRGSAFAIGREGSLLTNAHVVSAAVPRSSPENWRLVQPSIGEDSRAFNRALGEPELKPAEFEAILAGLFGWYARRAEVVGAKVSSVRIVLDYKADPAKGFSLLRRQGLAEALAAKPEEITVPAEVLAMGEPMPGKDVAVLKVTFAPEEQARLQRIGREQKLPPGTLEAWLADIQGDRLICLPLGNSEEVLPQDRVQALGMPGVAFNAELMEAEARYKVSARGGQISQSKRMKGGWDAFEMTAVIHHGDSGGPVLDARGRVIAINVGAASGEAGVRLAVPINIAREFLAKAGIKPDPGPLSEQWDRAVRLYARGEYQACYDQVQAVIRLQEGKREDREASYYVRDLAGRCLQKLGKIPGGG